VLTRGCVGRLSLVSVPMIDMIVQNTENTIRNMIDDLLKDFLEVVLFGIWIEFWR
jgi:hypothetical protein